MNKPYYRPKFLLAVNAQVRLTRYLVSFRIRQPSELVYITKSWTHFEKTPGRPG